MKNLIEYSKELHIGVDFIEKIHKDLLKIT